jgi:hypothetical protein
LAEHTIRNRGVAGSIPASGSMSRRLGTLLTVVGALAFIAIVYAIFFTGME